MLWCSTVQLLHKGIVRRRRTERLRWRSRAEERSKPRQQEDLGNEDDNQEYRSSDGKDRRPLTSGEEVKVEEGLLPTQFLQERKLFFVSAFSASSRWSSRGGAGGDGRVGVRAVMSSGQLEEELTRAELSTVWRMGCMYANAAD